MRPPSEGSLPMSPAVMTRFVLVVLPTHFSPTEASPPSFRSLTASPPTSSPPPPSATGKIAALIPIDPSSWPSRPSPPCPIACRQEDKPHTVKEIRSVANGATKKEISRAKEYIVKQLELEMCQSVEMGTIHAGDFMRLFCSNLGMNNQVVKAAQEIV
ncbi:hypothetical protein ACSBR1_043149 [Camellia fascicularis]